MNGPLSPLNQQMSLMALPFSLLLPIHSLCNPEQVSLMACPFSLLLSIHSFCNLEQVGRMEVFFVLTQDAMLIMCLLVDLLHILFQVSLPTNHLGKHRHLQFARLQVPLPQISPMTQLLLTLMVHLASVLQTDCLCI